MIVNSNYKKSKFILSLLRNLLLIFFGIIYFGYFIAKTIDNNCVDKAEIFTIKRKRRESISTIKQKVVDNMVDLLQESSKLIELNAQIQQKLQKYVLDFASNNKDNFLVDTKDRNKLEQILSQLRKASLDSKDNKAKLLNFKEQLNF